MRDMQLTAVVLSAFLAVSSFAQAPDLFGYASNDPTSNRYVVQNTNGAVAATLLQNEVSRVLLTDETGAVRDLFGRVTWFDRDARTIVQETLGAEFKLSRNLLAVYTLKSYARVYDRSGAEVFRTQRPVRGMTVTDTRLAWIDDWRESLELRDLKQGRTFTYPFVQNAWMSESFLYTRNRSRDQLYGRNQKLFPTERSVDVQLSDDLAVLTTADGRVKVYRPDGWRFTRADVKKVVLTANYLALTDKSGMDVYHRDGSFAARYLSTDHVDYHQRVIAIHLPSGATEVIRPAEKGAPAAFAINRSDSVVLSPTLALSNNRSFYELYSLAPETFGQRLYGGPRTNDAKALGFVGLRTFGFLFPTARTAQLFQPQDVALKTVLDERFIFRVDVSTEASSLNWTMF
jgi:hypothetical protein